jgi:hypothetical protein
MNTPDPAALPASAGSPHGSRAPLRLRPDRFPHGTAARQPLPFLLFLSALLQPLPHSVLLLRAISPGRLRSQLLGAIQYP